MPTLAEHDLDYLLGPEGPLALALPGYEHRREQAAVCRAIDDAFTSENHLLVEAGTGIGKTLAYLIPAVRAIARGKKVVVSTHTISLQTQLVKKDIPLVQALFPEVAVMPVLMKGRGNYLCLQDLDAGDADLFKAMDPLFRKVKSWSRKTNTGDVADLPFALPYWHEIAANIDTCRNKECRYYDRCFYYKMRWSAAEANLFVVNHALFLSDLSLRQVDSNSSILPAYDYVVFDEAHHLEDVATKVFGIEVSNRRVPHFLERVRRTRDLDIDVKRLDAAEDMNNELFAIFDSGRQEFFFHDALEPAGLIEANARASALCIAMDGIQNELATQAKEAKESLSERLEGLARMGARLKEELHMLFFNTDPDYIRWGAHTSHTDSDSESRRARHRPRTTLHYTPVEVGKRMQATLWPTVKTAILTSATLANSGGFSYLRARLGVPESSRECLAGSPFDFKQQALLYVPGHLPPPKGVVPEGDFAAAAADEIARLVELTHGRAFLLFTSRRMLNLVYDLLSERLPYPLFRQGDMPPGRLVDEFRESGNGCLFGTQTFWEGVDVQGEALSCVIIDRLPFAVPDSPITRARTDAIKEAGGDWFNDFSVPQAQIRLKQGFGRLIRTRTDRGIVCILDTRLLHKAYGAEFVRYLPPASRASIWSRVERFWDGD